MARREPKALEGFDSSDVEFDNLSLKVKVPEYGATLTVGAGEFVARHHLEGPMFNNLAAGSYLVWRLRGTPPVLVDAVLPYAAFPKEGGSFDLWVVNAAFGGYTCPDPTKTVAGYCGVLGDGQTTLNCGQSSSSFTLGGSVSGQTGNFTLDCNGTTVAIGATDSTWTSGFLGTGIMPPVRMGTSTTPCGTGNSGRISSTVSTS